MAIVDPGPDLPDHIRAVARAVADAERVQILLTHGHQDHAGGVDALLGHLDDAEVMGSGHPSARPLAAGDAIPTDAGPLTVVPTPGHARDHLAFLWAPGSALFAGDLVLGVGDTTWVGEYPGCVADYLASLDRVEALGVARILPAHGPDILDPPGVLQAYRAHRLGRIDQVRRLLDAWPAAQLEELVGEVYGTEVPPGVGRAVRSSLKALIEYVDHHRE